MDLQGLQLGSTDWIDLAHDTDRWQALLNVVMNFLVPYNVENFSISFAWTTLFHGFSS